MVVVEASLRSRDLAVAASWIEQVKPDYVLGAVAATAKRADVEHWRAQVGRLDALALSRLGHTASPGELMGLLPIAFLDGEEASTLRWVLTLLRTTLERAAVKRREYHALAADVRRFRPIVVIVLTVIVLAPQPRRNGRRRACPRSPSWPGWP